MTLYLSIIRIDLKKSLLYIFIYRLKRPSYVNTFDFFVLRVLYVAHLHVTWINLGRRNR